MESKFHPAQKLVAPVAAAATVYAFGFTGLARYAPPEEVFAAGAVLAGGVLIFLLQSQNERAWKRIVIGMGMSALGAIMLGFLGDGAAKVARVNDQRCLAIQVDMLSAHSRMVNPADAFQALGCRPQGHDPRIFVLPTNRERGARKPLPWGGYPPQ